MKYLAFHEIGHASHYAGSAVDFYRGLITAAVGTHDGHGNPDVILAGHIQVAESWADHMARVMLIRTFPLHQSRNSGFFGDWVEELESIRNESFEHIPIGLYNDLIDPVNNREFVYDENQLRVNPGGIIFINDAGFDELVDLVPGGYTNSFFAQVLDESITSPEDFKNICIQDLPAGVSEASVNTLFDQYE